MSRGLCQGYIDLCVSSLFDSFERVMLVLIVTCVLAVVCIHITKCELDSWMER